MPEELGYAQPQIALPLWVKIHSWIVIGGGLIAIPSLAIAIFDYVLNDGMWNARGPSWFLPIFAAAFFSPLLLVMAGRRWPVVRRRDLEAARSVLWIEGCLAAFLAFVVISNVIEAWRLKSNHWHFYLLAGALFVGNLIFAVGIWRTHQWLQDNLAANPRMAD